MEKVQKRTKKSGHTLIEVMLASFMALCCALIFAATIPTSNNSRVRADLNNRATGLANKQIEAIRARGFGATTPTLLKDAGIIDSATAVATNTYSFTNVDAGIVDSPATTLPNGIGRVTLENITTDLIRVRVQVTYSDRGTNRTVTVSTLVANL